MFPDSWGSDMDYAEAMGTNMGGRRPRRRIEPVPPGETGRELTAAEAIAAITTIRVSLSKVGAAKTKGAA
jgi:hypothetical protein